jgi:integrase
MENKQPLFIPESKRGHGLYVFCKKCNTNLIEYCKESGKSLKLCKHGELHYFKVYANVPGTKNQRKTKKLKTRNVEEAIIQAIEFNRQVKEGTHQIIENKVEKFEIIKEEQSQTQPKLLIHAMARYIGWLHNEGVPAHRIRERSGEHIKDVERAFKRLAECLKGKGYDLHNLSIDDLNDAMVGVVFSYLEEKKFSPRNFNKTIGYYTSFLKWYADEYNQPIKNFFERINRKKLNPNPEAITRKEYEALLNQIKPETGTKEYSWEARVRNVYRPWLKDGVRLGLETGRRREELINLKWDNIENSEGIQVIRVEDYKVNRIQNRTNEEKKFIYIPITESLKQLLNELGYEKNANTDSFILAQDIKISRTRVMSDILSRGFSHYYNQLNTGRKLTFKSLRKAYITNLELYMGNGNTKAITGHSDNGVIERSYIDKKEIAKAMRGFNVFSKESGRTSELNEIRNESIENQKLKSREV